MAQSDMGKIRIVEEHKIIGDCLEGIGIPNGGIAVIDRVAKPNVFDVVWCDNAVGGAINGCLKQIIQTGKHPIVHTVYKDHKRDYAFFPAQIFGVVLKVMDYDRNVVWERPEPVEYAPVKRGRWERAADGAAYCTACKRKMNPSLYGYAHCALCGAEMGGE